MEKTIISNKTVELPITKTIKLNGECVFTHFINANEILCANVIGEDAVMLVHYNLETNTTIKEIPIKMVSAHYTLISNNHIIIGNYAQIEVYDLNDFKHINSIKTNKENGLSNIKKAKPSVYENRIYILCNQHLLLLDYITGEISLPISRDTIVVDFDCIDDVIVFIQAVTITKYDQNRHKTIITEYYTNTNIKLLGSGRMKISLLSSKTKILCCVERSYKIYDLNTGEILFYVNNDDYYRGEPVTILGQLDVHELSSHINKKTYIEKFISNDKPIYLIDGDLEDYKDRYHNLNTDYDFLNTVSIPDDKILAAFHNVGVISPDFKNDFVGYDMSRPSSTIIKIINYLNVKNISAYRSDDYGPPIIHYYKTGETCTIIVGSVQLDNTTEFNIFNLENAHEEIKISEPIDYEGYIRFLVDNQFIKTDHDLPGQEYDKFIETKAKEMMEMKQKKKIKGGRKKRSVKHNKKRRAKSVKKHNK